MDPANPNNKYEGTKEQWDHAQSVMERILKDLDVDYTVGIDEAAFYGPKLDIQYKNVYGKEDTLVTIQIDMLLAERFGMYYIDENGEKKLPYIIHRTSLGCYERTLAYLIEEYAGALPTWMAPEQVRFLPVTDRAADYCAEQAKKLEDMASASRSTTATRRSAARSATRRWRRSPTWWSSATATWRTAPFPRATARTATSAR